MSSGEDDWRNEMRNAADEAAQATNEELAAQLRALQQTSVSRLDELRPQITDKEAYDKLIEAVAESTKQNESIAQLQERIKTLGSAVVEVAGKAAKLLV